MFFIIYLKLRTSKKHENFMEMTRLLYLSNPTVITFLSVIIWEIELSQAKVDPLSGVQNSLGCALFLLT